MTVVYKKGTKEVLSLHSEEELDRENRKHWFWLGYDLAMLESKLNMLGKNADIHTDLQIPR